MVDMTINAAALILLADLLKKWHFIQASVKYAA